MRGNSTTGEPDWGTPPGDAATTGYGYDAAGRLTDVTTGSVTTQYDYDANGNRLQRSGPDGSALGTYDVQDRLLTYGSLGFTYTANGEVASSTLTNADNTTSTTNYTYDALGNLREVVLADGTTIDYPIDGQNRRVGKKVNGVLVRAWIYEDQLRIAAEIVFDASGTSVVLVKRFVYGSRANVPDQMILSTGQTYRILSDHLGSPRAIVDSTGNVVEQIDYDEFGVRSIVAPDLTEGTDEDSQIFSIPFGFAGGLRDGESGLVRFGARDYLPVVGRWMSKDPALLGGPTSNMYEYADSDPVNLYDPQGTQSLAGAEAASEVIAAFAAAIGAVVGGGTRLPDPGEKRCLESNDKCLDENDRLAADPVCTPRSTIPQYPCRDCLEQCLHNRLKPLAILAGTFRFANSWPKSLPTGDSCGGDLFRQNK